MVASQKTTGTYEVTATDPAWDAIVRDCQSLGCVTIQAQDGQSFRLLLRPAQPSLTGRIASLPNFEARFRQIWLDGLALNKTEAAELGQLIAGE